MKLKTYDITVTVSFVVDGEQYDPSDWDHDEAEYLKWLKKNAVEGMRHADLDIGDAWVETVEEVKPRPRPDYDPHIDNPERRAQGRPI